MAPPQAFRTDTQSIFRKHFRRNWTGFRMLKRSASKNLRRRSSSCLHPPPEQVCTPVRVIQANPNIQTLPDSAYGSDLPPVFSVEETSVYTADADFDALSNQTEPAVVPAASIDSRLAAPHLSIYGYWHLNALGRTLWNGRSFSSQAASSSRPHHLRA